VLKKAGIVVAVAAAGMLAVSPLAFAGEGGDNWGHDNHHKSHSKSDDHSKSDNHSKYDNHSTTYDHSPQCVGAPQTALVNNPQNATGVSGLLGILGVGANVLGPVTAQLQTPILSCNNLDNIANVNVHDNFQDNG
jgi:hypothetical protein